MNQENNIGAQEGPTIELVTPALLAAVEQKGPAPCLPQCNPACIPSMLPNPCFPELVGACFPKLIPPPPLPPN